MDCPKCNATAEEGKLFCPQCGHRFQLDPIEGQVMSMEEWKLKKFREKDEARKAKMQENKPKYEAIKDRMYQQQSGFGVEELKTEVEKKKPEGPVTEPETKKKTEEKKAPGPYSELYDFENVAASVMDDIKKKDKGKKKYVRGDGKNKDVEAPELQPISDDAPKKRRRRKKPSE